MKRSSERILTTHADSFPRPEGLQGLIRDQLNGHPYQQEALARQVTIEHPELVAARIVNFARLVGRENVIAGTDCGFSQRALNPRLHPSIVWAKLRALSAGADLATRQLW